MIYYLFACTIHLTKDKMQVRLKFMNMFNLMFYREMRQNTLYWMEWLPASTIIQFSRHLR